MRAALPPEGTSNRRRRSAGQSLVEFTLVIPIFLLVLCGVFDGGRLVYMNTVLSQAAREAARVTSVEASWVGSTDPSCNTTGGPVCPANFDALLADATAAANCMVAPFGPIPAGHLYMSCDDAKTGTPPSGAWTGQSCSSGSSSNTVSVRVVMTFTAITPLVGQVIPSITLSGAATMVID